MKSVHTIKTKSSETNFQQKVLLISDVHWDNPKSDWDLLRKHLDEAKEKNAKILFNGDTFCLMQGKYDPRSAKSDIRPEHNVNRYLDAIVETAVEFFKPYADNIELFGYGNHEANIVHRQETDVLQRFVNILNHEAGTKIALGGYGGWVIFQHQIGTSTKGYKIKYFHGSGGGAPVTKGNIQHNRMSTFVQGADLIWQGHVHNDYETTYQIEYLDNNNRVRQKPVLMVRTSTYKEEYKKGLSGWHVERGAPPKPLGGRWLDISFKKTTNTFDVSAYTYRAI